MYVNYLGPDGPEAGRNLTPMEEPWWAGLTDCVFLSDCKQLATRKSGRLIGTELGIEFVAKGQRDVFTWSEIRGFRISRTENNEWASVEITHKFVAGFESRWIDHNDSAMLDKLVERIETFREKSASTEVGSVSFPSSRYLGGLPEHTTEMKGTLNLNRSCIQVGNVEILNWIECSGVAIESSQVAKRKVGATLVFGILGGVAAKGSKDQSVLTVGRRDGTSAYFEIDNKSWQEVKAKISPLLNSLSIPMYGEMPSQAPGGSDVVSDLERLVELKASGHIDEDEYARLKSKLIG